MLLLVLGTALHAWSMFFETTSSSLGKYHQAGRQEQELESWSEFRCNDKNLMAKYFMGLWCSHVSGIFYPACRSTTLGCASNSTWSICLYRRLFKSWSLVMVVAWSFLQDQICFIIQAILSCIHYKQSIISSATNGSSLLAWKPFGAILNQSHFGPFIQVVSMASE